ncbi:MAG: squalene/phytoene synthase family protein, partial [Burkholderiaceae bacterium]
LMMGVRSPDGLARACDLGVAMQLSNIARDVGEDARMGRLYLPLTWLREAGVEPDAWLAQPLFSAAIAGVVRRLLDAAAVLYRRVDAGVAQLPVSCRPGINAARYLYAEIGHEVARRGFDSVSQRARVSRARKSWLLACSGLQLVPSVTAQTAPPLDATRFLIDACSAATPSMQRATLSRPAWWNVTGRVVSVLDLFERLERLDQQDNVRRLHRTG